MRDLIEYNTLFKKLKSNIYLIGILFYQIVLEKCDESQ